MTVGPPPLPPMTVGSWWSRHKLWVIVPLAILAGIAALVVFAALIMAFVFGMIRSTDAYQQGLTRARADTTVVGAIGAPIEPGWVVAGNIDLTNDSGTADISIPVAGPRGTGTIHVIGTKTAGVWTYSELDVTVEPSHRVIDLRKPAP